MQIRHLTWPPDDDLAKERTTLGGSFSDDYDQPGFGMSIGWNKPRRWWEPWIAMQVWTWHVQIGWLYE